MAEKREASDSTLVLLEAKRNVLFERLQQLYDVSREAYGEESARESFLGSVMCLEQLRSDFTHNLDKYNERLLAVTPKATPNYSPLISFDDLYGRVMYARSKLSDNKNNSDSSKNKNRPRLPPMELLSFNGDIRSWPLFYANFKSTIHDNPSLSDSEKLHYLLGKLTGRALNACAGITPCAENYNLLMQALIDKYEDKRMLAATYINQILEFKSLNSASYVNFDTFLDQFVSAVKALKLLNLNDLTDYIFTHIALKKLDPNTVRLFEMNNDCGSDVPKFDSLVEFIKSHSKLLQRTPVTSSTPKKPAEVSRTPQSNRSAPKYQSLVATSPTNIQDNSTIKENGQKCLCDNFLHYHLFKCPAFENMSPADRFKCVRERNGCVNCLSLKHRVSYCHSPSNCRMCRLRHHTLLHFTASDTDRNVGTGDTIVAVPPSVSLPQPQPAPQPPNVALCSTSEAASPHCPSRTTSRKGSRSMSATVLLATAQIMVYDNDGNGHLMRCLLDSGSQSNFITVDCCKRLNIRPRRGTHSVVSGIGGSEKVVRGSVPLSFSSRFKSDIKFDISSLVVDHITDSLPTALADPSALVYFKNLPLADELYATPNPIDVLIGASLFPHLLLPDVVRSGASGPHAIETVLGYVIMGTVPALQVSNATVAACCLAPEQQVDKLLQKFWELEELITPPIRSHADDECEEFYKVTTTRDPASGRYEVALPFQEDPFLLGDSLDVARKRFYCLERKLEASPKLRSAYDEVIKEYINNDYISLSPPDNPADSSLPAYIIPHHGVIREDKATTKLRIVLDASCKTTSKLSLNDVLHGGPNLQGDLFQIILNFRLFAFALSADCKQMFHQIVMRECDRRYQRILYRFNPRDPLIIYQFNRVCFGIKSSPYHALRTVKQLVEDDGSRYPLAREVISSSLYMDDVVFSTMGEAEGIQTANELINLLKGAQWDLVKWTSNSRAILDGIPASHKLDTEVEFDKTVHQKILGLHWSKDTDAFYFKIVPPSGDCTKRIILSTVARLWDVMGFAAPTIVNAKLLIKQLWILKVGWDDTPPAQTVKSWRQFCEELPLLNGFQIPRHLGVFADSRVTLIGFSDASGLAYGGVVYLRTESASGVSVKLVCAKSKVAPVRTVSVARLELCAAVLLSSLLRVVLDNYSARCKNVKVFAFTDSEVVLYWIKGSPHRWQTFVANRVVKLNENIPAHHFFHVAGSQNPADCLSRGLTPQNLLNHPLWPCGPPWLSLDQAEWPLRDISDKDVVPEDLPERKILAHPVLASTEDSVLYTLATRVSSWTRLLRVIVFVYRFIKIFPRRASPAITIEDLDSAEAKLLRILQTKYFESDYIKLKKGERCSPPLNKLSPFLENHIIRVGGRLNAANLDWAHKHPIILPRSDRIVELIIEHYHIKYLHAGPELLLSLLRQKYWILAGRRTVRYIVHKCNTCFRLKPRPSFPLMANLPDMRVNPAIKAFSHTGCDYAGPILYTPIRRRGTQSRKAYLCIFTCLTTRAVHIEVATDLSTVNFLAALKRFLSRRGPVQVMYSDNGTNFTGASSYLRELYKFLNGAYRSRLQEELIESRIEWKFIPPASPHFGGCWESMVKIVKAHFFRVVGQQLLSYEELITVLAQIECLLNSRPLTVLSSDPAEPTALTPSHFLHTTPLCSLPAPQVETERLGLLHRHSLLDKLVQGFWERWRVEYLHGLQERSKWNQPSDPITVGTIVVIMTDNAPVLAWPLGVITEVHPSKDGVVRVATVKTARGVFLRPVVRLCPLPNQ